jgi:hypothetical protein
MSLVAAPIMLLSPGPGYHAASQAHAVTGSILHTGQCLVSSLHGYPVAGSQLFSASGVFNVWVQPESVEIDENETLPGGVGAGTTTWWQFMYPNSGTLPPDRSKFCMQGSGSLTLRTSKGKLIWSSHSAGTGRHNYAKLRNDGNLVIYTSKGRAVWSTRTTRTILPDGSILASGHHLVYRYRQQFGLAPTWLVMRRTGDLVLLQSGRVLWSTRTHVKGAYAELLGHGNFVVYAPSGRVLWLSRTHGRPSFLELTGGCLTFNTSYGTVWSRPRGACTL